MTKEIVADLATALNKAVGEARSYGVAFSDSTEKFIANALRKYSAQLAKDEAKSVRVTDKGVKVGVTMFTSCWNCVHRTECWGENDYSKYPTKNSCIRLKSRKEA